MDKRKSNGQFASGNKGKPAGSSSVKTTEIRESFKLLIENNLEDLETKLQALKPKEYFDVILGLSKFVIPTLKATDMKIEDVSKNEFKPIVIHFSDDDD